MKKKKVLVYPCGTEIGLEIYRAVHNSTYFELIGGSSTRDHGEFVYKKHLGKLPFISDDSNEDEIRQFNEAIEEYQFDFIYPAMDGVLSKFARYKDLLSPMVIGPSYETAKITRSKILTYHLLNNVVNVPRQFETIDDVSDFPIFIKPDVGQGSVGAFKVYSKEDYYSKIPTDGKRLVITEYLPGEEYTVDCFTNINGEVIYAGGRIRNRMKNGISVNCVEADDATFLQLAKKINSKIKNIGGWFFQVKKNGNGDYVLLEVASRIAGTSAFCRCLGINMPLLTLFSFSGNLIDRVEKNRYEYYEIDRALYNSYKIDFDYDTVYIDFDDTIYIDGKINTQIISFLFQCINNHIAIILITKHAEDIRIELEKLRLSAVFDRIIQIQREEEKYKYIVSEKAIFIDDSFGERIKIKNEKHINVFDTHMIECLMEEGSV